MSFYFFGLGAEEECGARCRLAPLRRDVAVPVRDDFRDDFCLRLANGGDARGSSCLPTLRGDCVREGPAADAEEESCCARGAEEAYAEWTRRCLGGEEDRSRLFPTHGGLPLHAEVTTSALGVPNRCLWGRPVTTGVAGAMHGTGCGLRW